MPSDNLIGIVAIEVDSTRSGIQPCCLVNRGIYNAGTLGGAGFRFDFNFVYKSGGELKTDAFQIGLADTKLAGDFDSRSKLVEASFQVSSKIDANTQVTGSVQLVAPGQAGDPDNPDEPIGEPQSLTVPV